MKKIFFISILFVLIVINNSNALYNGWNILSTRRGLASIVFISDSKGWILGGDIAYKTIDGGLSWSYPIKMNYNLTHVFFVDSLYGWVAQGSNILLKTTNGGDYWATLNTGLNSEYKLYTVHFVNRLTGWAVGRRYFTSPEGAIVKTTNGGINWISQNSNFNRFLTSIYMLNENKGFASSWDRDSILETTNGGNNWLKRKIPGGQPVHKIWFIDSLNGWAIGTSQYICKTTNGGINWNISSIPFGNPTNFYFLNILTGWITYQYTYNAIYKSTNGGTNWFIQYYAPCTVNDIYFKNENTGWALKADGTVLKSINGGTNWMEYINHPFGNINSIYFSDISTGWLASNYSDGINNYGLIYKTTNSGVNWNNQYTSVSSSISTLTFINNTTGFASSNAKIYKTVNGGLNWVANNVVGTHYYSIFFINNNTGWACGEDGYIIKTTNSGENWINKVSNVTYRLYDIQFINPQEGYIASHNGYVLKTTNGGDNWNLIHPHSSDLIYRAVHFINSNTGFVVGTRIYYYGWPPSLPYSDRLLLKTTNGGLSWAPKINVTSGNHYYFNDLFFINDNTGWVITSNNEIRKTTNIGENWFFEQSPTNESFNCVQFINTDVGWIGGNRGTVLTTIPLTGIKISNNKIPQNYHLKQNYPNPFNPVTKISYDLISNGYAELKVFDLLGREITSLVNERQNAGSYEVEWNASGFPSGVYFYRLETRGFSEVRKMVLLK